MLLNLIEDYFDEVETATKSIKDCYIEKYEEEILSAERANLRIRIRFLKGHLLFRYDNAPHFPNLKTFPHHKHIPNDVIPVTKPLITEVIEEAKKLV